MSELSNSGNQKGGRKGWTTVEQCDWLQENVSNFLVLRSEGHRRLDSFWLRLFDGWFERWPEDPELTNNNDGLKQVCIVVRSGPELIDYPL